MRTITTPEEFNEFMGAHRSELDARCIINGATCFNDKLDALDEILSEEGVEIDSEMWPEFFDEIVIGTWEPNHVNH